MNWDALYARLAICGNIKERTMSVVSNGEYKILIIIQGNVPRMLFDLGWEGPDISLRKLKLKAGNKNSISQQ